MIILFKINTPACAGVFIVKNYLTKENIMEKQTAKPYVISEELDLSGIYTQQINLKNLDVFRANLDADLKAMGKNTLWVSSAALNSGLARMVDTTNVPVVSLDDRYVKLADQYFGVSRGVDETLNDVGYVPRANYASIQSQLDSIPKLGREVVLADDVLFSGEMMEWLISELAARNVKVGGVVCGIAMGEGVARLGENNISVEACEVFEDVEDEICERDFAIVSGSGRRIDSLNANALYFDSNNGKPQQWACIPPEAVDDFYKNGLIRSASLLQEDVRMESIGNFLGYNNSGNAKREILQQLEVRL